MIEINQQNVNTINNENNHSRSHSQINAEDDDNILVREKLPEKKEIKKKSVSYFKLQYYFARKSDYCIIICAVIGSLVAGVSFPIISLLLGSSINNFGPNMDISTIDERVKGLIINFILAGIGIFIGCFMMTLFWSLTGKRLINRIKETYFTVLMKQEQGYFDECNVFEFATKVQYQTKIIEQGVNYFF